MFNNSTLLIILEIVTIFVYVQIVGIFSNSSLHLVEQFCGGAFEYRNMSTNPVTIFCHENPQFYKPTFKSYILPLHATIETDIFIPNSETDSTFIIISVKICPVYIIENVNPNTMPLKYFLENFEHYKTQNSVLAYIFH